MSTKFLSPGWRMPKNANQSKQANYSLNFDGNDAIEIPQTTATDITGSNTIAMWVKRSTSGSNQNLVNKRGNSGTQYAFFIETTNFLGFDDGTGAKAYGNTVIPTNAWTHVAVVVESSGCTFYVNGVSDGGVSSGISVGANTHTTYIGKKYTSTFYLNGKLSQVCFFDYALSQSQVTTLYGTGSAIGNPMALPSPPIAYYPLGTSAWNGDYLTENNAIGDYVFDFASSDSIDTNFTLPNYNSYSISVWYKKDRGTVGALPAGDHYLWGNATSGGANKPRTSVRFNDTNELRIITGDGTVYFQSPDLNVSTLLLDGKWHHILTTTVSGEIKLYIDGGLQATHTNSNIITGIVAETSYRIGQSGYNAGYLTESLLSNFQLFNTALSGPEVETLYNYGSPIRTLANIPQSSNLKAWYKLDATEIYNSTSTEWEVNNALSPWTSSLNFNGSSDYINCGNDSSLRITTEMTVSAWFKIDNSSSNAYFNIITKWISGDAAWSSYVTKSTGILSFWISTNGSSQSQINSTTNVNDGNWHHFIGTNDGVNNKLYIDGVLEDTGTSGNIFNSTQNVLIGKTNNNSFFFNGQISNVQIFNTALTDGTGGTVNQIETIYNSGNPLTDMSSFSSLVSWWKLDNTTTGIEDSKGSNNGTNNGATEAPGSVSTLNGESSGMSQSNLVQSDLQTVAPYSKYALSFDGTNDYIDCGDSDSFSFGDGATDSPFSISAWVNMVDATNFITIAKDANSGREYVIRTLSDDKLYFYLLDYVNGGYIGRVSSGTVTPNQSTWIHTSYTYNGNSSSSGIKIYLNGSQVDNANYGSGSYTAMSNTSTNLNIGRQERGLHYGSGSISNVSIFDSALTSSQVREIYNEGLPSNLNTFSGAAPVAWWQLGSNSSWNGNRWIVADEKGTNNGYSQNMSPYMPESGLTNGVGTTANGTSTGMSEGSLVGDAPYSTGNAISSGMPVTARGTDVPPTP